MRIREPGKICDGLYLLGLEESSIYWMEGKNEAMLINGGMNYSAPVVRDQIKKLGLQEQRLTRMLILHAHFDHVGIIPFFKRRRPKTAVYASARGWTILGMPKAIKTINEFSRVVARHLGRLHLYDEFELDWGHDIQGQALSEGDRLDLGELEVKIYETPGHSSCSISAYVPSRKILFPSDGGGIPYRDTTVIAGNSNFTQYQQSLEKLKKLPVDMVCADHYGCVTGNEAKNFIESAAGRAADYRRYMEQVYLKLRDIDAAAKQISDEFLSSHPQYMIPSDIYEMVCRQVMRHLAAALDEEAAV